MNRLGEQARPVYKMGGIRVYLKHLSNGSMAVAVLNTSKREKHFDLKASLLGIKDPLVIHDVWKHADIGTLKDKLALTIKSHEAIVLTLVK